MLSTKIYYTYQIDNYIYEIYQNEELTEIWLYHKDYGIKMHIIEVPESWEEGQIINYIILEHERNKYIYNEDVL